MFSKLFDPNNPFMLAMGRVFDITVLNLLWLLCSLPVVTIGPATTAFYYAMLNLVRGEETTVRKDFFRSFRRDLKASLALGLFALLSGLFLFLERSLARGAELGRFYNVFLLLFGAQVALWGAVLLYAFPLLAKFDNTPSRTLALALTQALSHLPQTLILLALEGVALWLCRLSPFFLLFIFGFVGQLQCTVLAGVFKPWLDGEGQAGT